VPGEVADQHEVVVVEGRLVRTARDGDDTEDRIVGDKRHDDGRALAHVGEAFDGVLERVGDQR
jgi:hypothetical protein